MVNHIKFSEFADGGDISNDKTTVGLNGGVNTKFNNPWTFLPPGTTGDRPIPAPAMYYRQRFNTTLEVYEYYDPTTLTWTQLSGSGTGTVNPGTANDIAFYAVNGQAISPIASNANAVLVSNGSEQPSMSTTLPSGLSIPGATISASTAALTSGSVVAAPVSGTDLVNKTYADGLFGSGVQSLTGTTNQISFTSPTGHVTASLPQDIALGSTPTFGGMTLSSIPLGGSSGGTGINNGGRTITIAGNLQTVGAFNSVFTMTGATGVTFPTSGTLATTAQLPTGAALTKVDDTNVTLSLGGTPATALLQSVVMTLGWSGQLAISRGGTGVSSVTTAPTASAFAGWDANSNLSASNHIEGFTATATASGTTTLTVSSTYIQQFTGTAIQTVTMPVTSTLVAGQSWQIINNSTGTVSVQSSGANVIVTLASNTAAIVTCVLTSGTTAASWTTSFTSSGSGSGTITNWVAYTPTFTGFGTVSNVQVWSRRVGDTLEMRGRFQVGTPTAVEARISLGYNGTDGNVTSSNTTITSIQHAGTIVYGTASTPMSVTLIEANVGYITLGNQASGSAGLTKQIASTLVIAGIIISFVASVPIASFP